MKYEYGVEYETKGEKPDLPGWVEVEWWNKHRRNWTNMTTVGSLNWTGNELNPPVEKFRIVDERWKSKPNNWHERGELPPVGTECLAAFLPNEVMAKGKRVDDGHCLIRGYNGNMVWLQWCEGDNFVNRVENFDFRPLRTEHDALVASAEHTIENTTGQAARSVHIAALIDAGWRPTKQQTEEEFVSNACTGYVQAQDMARAIYRAGCRFIEQGE